MSKKILFITTNFSKMKDDIRTGVYLEEFAVAFLTLKATSYDIVVTSPNGGKSPIDESSLSCSNPMEWDTAAQHLKNTIKLDEVNYKSFDAIYIPGGHGCLFDLVDNKKVKEIIEYMYEKNKIISAICHGVAVLINAKDNIGKYILHKKNVTGFTNKEEQIIKMQEYVPFSLEDKIKSIGGDFVVRLPWSEHIEVCENIITGQNQKSTLLLTEEIIRQLEKRDS